MNKAYKPMKSRLRATFAAGTVNEARLGSIDKENEVLHDVQITLEGEALGHGVFLDRAFCEAVAEQGNATGDAGVKVRFGHPSDCADALGTYLGRAKNFRCIDLTRKDGSAAAGVIADLHLDPAAHESPKGDLAAWVLKCAETAPDTFGQSIVFTYEDFKVKDAEGHEFCASAFENEEDWMAKSADGKVYAMLGKLLGTDFTDTPAATDGVFSADSLAAKVEDFIAENPQILESLEKRPDTIVQFLTRAGLMDKFESARVSGLQKREAEIVKKHNEALAKMNEDIEHLKADNERIQRESVKLLAEKDAKIAEMDKGYNELKSNTAKEISNITAKYDEARRGLEAATAEAGALATAKLSLEKALAEKQAALDTEIARYQAQVGQALKLPQGGNNEGKAKLTAIDRVAAGIRITPLIK